LNGNRISSIPEELGRLDSLEELNLSENSIEEIPMSIAQMGSLRILKLQNNRLTRLPSEIAELLTLEVLDCSGNKKLDMIPPMWLGDTEGILFILRIHRGSRVYSLLTAIPYYCVTTSFYYFRLSHHDD
jgi:Leucine-rich repeat (LRR) protein